jgi:uncharacterized protein
MADACAIHPTTKSIIGYLKLPPNGDPYLEGWRCSNCGETFIEPRGACSNCLTRGKMEPVKLANSGKLYNWTIVHRNFPGIKVPFISVIVDLDGGGTIKGNLIGIDPDPAQIAFDMPVDVVYRPLEQSDAEDNLYIGYFFVPAKTEGNKP